MRTHSSAGLPAGWCRNSSVACWRGRGGPAPRPQLSSRTADGRSSRPLGQLGVPLGQPLGQRRQRPAGGRAPPWSAGWRRSSRVRLSPVDQAPEHVRPDRCLGTAAGLALILGRRLGDHEVGVVGGEVQVGPGGAIDLAHQHRATSAAGSRGSGCSPRRAPAGAASSGRGQGDAWRRRPAAGQRQQRRQRRHDGPPRMSRCSFSLLSWHSCLAGSARGRAARAARSAVAADARSRRRSGWEWGPRQPPARRPAPRR